MATGQPYDQYGGGYYQPPQGQAQGYYNSAPGPNQYNGQYNGPPPSGAPPQYGNNNNSGYNGGMGEKPSFDEAFAVKKPKWNDLWAGILVRRHPGGDRGFPSASLPRHERLLFYHELTNLTRPIVLISRRRVRCGVRNLYPRLWYGMNLGNTQARTNWTSTC